MSKVAILIHQYGDEVIGGAESYAKSLAEHLIEVCPVTVLTTTSKDYMTWANYYPSGIELINGVEVIRFMTDRPRDKHFAELCNGLLPKLSGNQNTTYVEDYEWVDSEGPYCPQLVEYVREHHNDYDAFIVITYIYYIAVKCIPEIYDKAIFIPTAHDEPWIRLSIMKDIFRMPRYFGFLTEEEREFVHNRFHNNYIPSSILGIGIETKSDVNPEEFRVKYNVYGSYLIYVGRLDEAKGCDELVKYFLQYKKTHRTDLKLVFVGGGKMTIPQNPDIIATGYVSEQDKYNAIAGAFAMVTPSRYESLCIALLEALALEIPVIANAQCEVLKGQCIRSNAGLYYSSSIEFADIIDYLSNNPKIYLEMKKNGPKYISERYTWDIVINKILQGIEVIKEINQERNVADISDILISQKPVLHNLDSSIMPIWDDAVSIVILADNNNADSVGVMINSALKHIDDNEHYDFVIISNQMEDRKSEEIITLGKGRKNVCIRIADITGLLKKAEVSLENSQEWILYLRSILPQIVCNYKKIIYFNTSVIILCDLKELWDNEQTCFSVANVTYDIPDVVQKSDELYQPRILDINDLGYADDLADRYMSNCKKHFPRYLFKAGRRHLKQSKVGVAFSLEKTSYSEDYWAAAWRTPYYDRLIDKRINKINQVLSDNNKLDEISVCHVKKPEGQMDMQATTIKRRIKPVFKDNAVQIVFISDDAYAEYLGVAINSVICNSVAHRNYDIIVLTEDMKETNKRKIEFLLENRKNISVRFFSTYAFTSEWNLIVSDNYKRVTYYRLLLPLILDDSMERILYLDSDIIVNGDITELYDQPFDDNYVVGTYDTLIAAWQNYDSGMRAYFRALGVEDSGHYVQAGVLLLNLRLLSKAGIIGEMIRNASREKYIFNDQDLINIYFKKKIKIIDLKWDVMNLSNEGIEVCKKYLRKDQYQEFEESRKSPLIIHYVEKSFPCFQPDRTFAKIYWKYAKGTVFYNQLIEKGRMAQDISSENESVSNIQGKQFDAKSKIKLCLKRIPPIIMVRNFVIRRRIPQIHSKLNLRDMHLKGNAFATARGIWIFPGGEASGLNCTWGKGLHTVSIKVSQKQESGVVDAQLTAGARHILLDKINLKKGINLLRCRLSEVQIDVEILIKNCSESSIMIESIEMIHNN